MKKKRPDLEKILNKGGRLPDPKHTIYDYPKFVLYLCLEKDKNEQN